MDERLNEIKDLLNDKEEIRNNPFAVFSNKQCLKALELLEEYGEELTHIKGL